MLRELADEPTGLDDLEITDEPWIPQDDLQLRAMLIRIEQLVQQAEKVKATMEAVVDAYKRQLAGIVDQAEFLRRSLQAYVERHGTVKFPDVATAYLQDGKPKIEIADPEAFKAGLSQMFTREVFDETAAKQYALEQATGPTGELVAGARLVPGGPQLRIRKA